MSDGGTQQGGVEHEDPAPRIVVFDVGEVLIDETRVWQVWAELTGHSLLTFAAVLGAAVSQGQDHRTVFRHLAPNLEWETFADEAERRYGGFREADLYPDVRSCLAELTTAGFAVAIAGNQPAQRSAELAGLDLGVEMITTSTELGSEKPDATFFDAVLRWLDVEEPGDVLYVGDRVDNDVLGSLGAGMQACWVRRGPWGHLQELPDELDPAIVVEGLGELPTLLSSWRDG